MRKWIKKCEVKNCGADGHRGDVKYRLEIHYPCPDGSHRVKYRFVCSPHGWILYANQRGGDKPIHDEEFVRGNGACRDGKITASTTIEDLA